MSDVTVKSIKEEFLNTKQKIIDILERTVMFYEEENNTERVNVFSELKKKLENGEFSIVVVGEFSAGKSTLLNALMGQRLLPSYKNETTATVNFLRHIEKAKNHEMGRVFYNDGTEKVLQNATLDTVQQYVSTRGDNVAGMIDHLDLYFESDFLRDGVMLIDSPGLNGVAAGHQAITEEQIRKSHASIFLFTCDHPGSRSDFAILRDLQEQVKTIFVVLNKIDVLKIEEKETVDSVVQTLKNHYKEFFPEAETVPEIWPVSAQDALQARELDDNLKEDERKELEYKARMISFEERLMRFLTQGEKTRKELTAPLEHILNLVGNSRQSMQQELDSLNQQLDGDELSEQVRQLEDEAKKLDEKLHESRNIVRSQLRVAFNEVRDGMSAKISKLAEHKMDEITMYDDLDDLNDYISGFENAFGREVSAIVHQQDVEFRNKIEELIYDNYIQDVEQIETEINKHNHIAIKFDMQNHLCTQEYVCMFDFDVMLQEEKSLNQQLATLKESIEIESDGELESAVAQRKRRDLEDRLDQLQLDRNAMAARNIPPIGGHYDSRTEKVERTGVLGFIGNILFGKKEVKQQVYVEDRAEHDAAKKDKEKKLEEIERGISNTEGGREAVEKAEEQARALMKQYKARQIHIDKLEEQLDEIHSKNINDMKRERKKVISKCQRELRNFCNDTRDDLDEQAGNVMKDLYNAYITNICEAISLKIKDTLQQKKAELERLQQLLQASVADKEKAINELKNKISLLDTLLDEASDLKLEIENETIDEIKQEKLMEGA